MGLRQPFLCRAYSLQSSCSRSSAATEICHSPGGMVSTIVVRKTVIDKGLWSAHVEQTVKDARRRLGAINRVK